MLTPVRNSRYVCDTKGFGELFPTAEEVDCVLSFHNAPIMSALTYKCKSKREHDNEKNLYAHKMELKDVITQARLLAKMNKSELARACGVDPSAINHIEAGRTKALSAHLVLRLSQILSLSHEILTNA